MSFFAKLLLFGAMATALFFWQRSRIATDKPAIPDKAAAPRTAIQSADSSTEAARPPPSEATPGAIASLHASLREWQGSQASNPDDEEGRDRLTQELLATLTDANVAGVVQSLSQVEMKTSFGIGALHRWMKVAPVAATNWVALNPNTTEDETLTVAEDWIHNRDGLHQYVDQLPDTAWKQKFISSLSSEMSASDPQAAIKFAQQMKPGEGQTNLLRALACRWVDNDPVAALDWVSAIPDPSLREPLVASALQSYALSDPANAATWLISDVRSGRIAKEAALNILEIWVEKNPAEAAGWASQFPEGDLKSSAVQVVSKHWQQTDPEGAAAWIKRLPGSQRPAY